MMLAEERNKQDAKTPETLANPHCAMIRRAGKTFTCDCYGPACLGSGMDALGHRAQTGSMLLRFWQACSGKQHPNGGVVVLARIL